MMRSPASFPSSARRRRTEAFTVLEILVVLAIIGLMLGLVVTNTDKLFGQGQEAVAKIFVRDSVKTPLTRYRIDIGDFPGTNEGLAALITAPTNVAEKWRGPYMDVPSSKVPVDPWGYAYVYRYPGVKNVGGYDIFSPGVDHVVDTADDIGNW